PIRGVDQAEDLALLLVDPVVLVVDAVLALDLHVGRMGAGDVGCLDPRDVVLVHVQRHAMASWCLCSHARFSRAHWRDAMPLSPPRRCTPLGTCPQAVSLRQPPARLLAMSTRNRSQSARSQSLS